MINLTYYYGNYTPMRYDGQYLAHHGIKGQKWGIRRFQNPDGTLTQLGKVRYGIDPKDRVERKIGKRMDEYARIADRSDTYEQKSFKKGNEKIADFYKKQTEDAIKYLNVSAKMIEEYKKKLENVRKANNLISIVSRKPLRDIADSELAKARDLLANAVLVDEKLSARAYEDSAKRMYKIASRNKPKYESYQPTT